MKKMSAILLSFCLLLGFAVPFASAASTDQTTVRQTIQALGIITGDENGALNLSGNVTRAQFAKMLVSASVYKDTTSSNANASPFSDVKYTYWAASYIQAAVNAGWVTGYTDGTYRPDNNVTLEEAVSAVLKMLGYTSSDFSGSFPQAQLTKYAALGLNANISKIRGETLTRLDCMYLFYNLMGTNTTAGSAYAQTLGYSLNDSGELDYSSLVLGNMEGPYIVNDASWSSGLPFAASTATVYKNGALSSISAVATYDVYYYNPNLRTVWVYRNQVSGVYTAASPNTAAPTSVTISGQTYPVSTSSASYAMSDLGAYSIGDTVMLLLGMNGDVVGILSASQVNTTQYGIVLSTGTATYTDSLGKTYSSNTVTVACTDGLTYSYDYDTLSLNAGDLLQISTSAGELSIEKLSEKTLSGKVNASATTLGTYALADDVQIMDTTGNGTYCTVYPSRLAGLTLKSANIRYYVLDDAGEISCLILDDVTGDLYDYVLLTDVSEESNSSSFSVFCTYQYLSGSTSGTYTSRTTVFNVSKGPAQVELDGTTVVGMDNLSKITIAALNSLNAQSTDSVQYTLSEQVDVYVYRNGDYYASSIASVNDLDNYTLYGYYDKATTDGGRVRIIIAYEK